MSQPADNRVAVAAAIVSACALIFTVASFWWIQMRRGRLKGYPPHSFAAAGVGSANLRLRLPVVIFNTGAAPIVVLDIQLRFPDEPDSLIPLPWATSRNQLKPTSDDGHTFPGVFAVPGRSAEQHFIEFFGPVPGFAMQPESSCRCVIDVKLGHNEKWKPLVDFPLFLSRALDDPNNYIAYSNRP